MKKTRELVLSGLFAAIIAVFTFISIPSPSGIPLTLQTFAIALCGYVCGAKRAMISVAVYIAVGLVGAPVFSGFRGGFQVIAGPTGGFIAGFFAIALLCGIKTGKLYYTALLSLSGIIICHILGVVWFSVLNGTDFIASFMISSLPYIPKDIISVFSAYLVSKPLIKALKRIE